ncbi:unnamed protein product [Lupinus luteus]|uniref:Uncharacterized protein n=1 Tax=Lupinus luteus TaxID=3873 RepID=A0AAV1Y189_LUPLU
MNWSLTFGMAIDAIWKNRNLVIFENVETIPHRLVAEIWGHTSSTGRIMRLGKHSIVRHTMTNLPNIR